MSEGRCSHPSETLSWLLAEGEAYCNEAGWYCGACGGALGFRPDLDRSHTDVKVHSLLMDLHEGHLVHVSNGTQGELIAEHVAWRCQQDGVYDQLTIVRLILGDPNLGQTHGAYWQARSEEWLREREGGAG